jgi:hypothetical protein
MTIFKAMQVVKTAAYVISERVPDASQKVRTCATSRRVVMNRYEFKSTDGLGDLLWSMNERPTIHNAATNCKAVDAMASEVTLND